MVSGIRPSTYPLTSKLVPILYIHYEGIVEYHVVYTLSTERRDDSKLVKKDGPPPRAPPKVLLVSIMCSSGVGTFHRYNV